MSSLHSSLLLLLFCSPLLMKVRQEVFNLIMSLFFFSLELLADGARCHTSPLIDTRGQQRHTNSPTSPLYASKRHTGVSQTHKISRILLKRLLFVHQHTLLLIITTLVFFTSFCSSSLSSCRSSAGRRLGVKNRAIKVLPSSLPRPCR